MVQKRLRRWILCLLLSGGCTGSEVSSTQSLLAAGIDARLVLRVGDAAGSGIIGRPQAITSDPRGRIWLVSEETAHQISVFDPSGAFVFAVGREGDGPGEFRNISSLAALPGGSVLVFDQRLGRASVVRPDGTVVESAQFSLGGTAAMANDSGIVVVTRGGRPGITDFPAVVLTESLEVIGVTGAEPPGLEYDFYDSQRVLTWATPSTIWMTPAYSLHLEEWTVDGELVQQWERNPEWMPSGQPWHPATEDEPPTPTVRALDVDDQNRVWAAVSIGEPDWQLGLGEPVGNPESAGRMWPIDDVDALLGTRIEVMSADSREVLGSGYTDEFFFAVLPDGRWVSYRESDEGVPRVLIWHLRYVPEADRSTT